MDSTRKNILIALPTSPYPQRGNGVGMRYVPILSYFAKKNTVDVLLFGESNDTQQTCLENNCNQVYYVREYTGTDATFFEKVLLRGRTILPWTPPLTYSHFRSKKVSTSVANIIAHKKYDSIIWVAANKVEYLLQVKNLLPPTRLIIDLIDSIFLHASRKSIGENSFPLLERYEVWKIRKWETKVINSSDASIYISDIDAAAIPEKLTPNKQRFIIPNGVYSEDYTSETIPEIKSPSIGFLGNMSYGPNIDAVLWFYKNVFLELKETIPNISLYVVGRNPVDSIIKLTNDNNVHVTGTVDSIWPYINSIDLFAIPLQKGAGLKNKILDIMRAGKPVITSDIGNEGINAINNEEILICNTPKEYINSIITLIDDNNKCQSIGKNAQRFLVKNFSWSNILKNMEKIIFNH